MRKTNRALVLSFFIATMTTNAQTEKKVPPPPPPMEAAKANPPKIVKDEVVKTPPVSMAKGQLADGFYERNPTVSEISREGNIITLKMKDGTIEKYDINKKEEDKNFTDRYGRAPIPPPPPPPKVRVTKSKG